MIELTPKEFLERYNTNKIDVKWNNIIKFIPSSTNDETLKFICSFGGPDKKIFEFGTWIGRSTLGFSQNFNEVVSIDCIEASDIKYSYAGYTSGHFVKDIKNVKLINIDSKIYDFKQYLNYFDIVFVDGEHSINGVLSDTKNSLLITKNTSIIFFDDYIGNFEVKPAINAFEFKNKVFIKDINLVAFIKE